MTRRAFLRTAGALTVALPALELTHGKAWAQAPENIAKRYVGFFSHGGYTTSRGVDGRLQSIGSFFGHDLWRPPYETETLTTLGEEMLPLEGAADKLLILRGMVNRAGIEQGEYGGGHGFANVTALTSNNVSVLTRSNGETYQTAEGPSIDQVISDRLMQRTPTPFARIDLAVDGHNYGTPFFSAARQPIEGEGNVRTAFDSLFTGVSPEEPSPEMERLRLRKKSVLDGVLDGFATFKRNLSVADTRRVDAHFEFIRALERRINGLGQVAECTVPTRSDPRPAEFTGPIMIDLIVHAFRCGLSNVATFNLADITTPWTTAPLSDRGMVGYDIGHSLHHFLRDLAPGGANDNDRDRADWRTEMVANRRWRLGLFRRLMDGLAESGDGAAGSMLDTSIIYLTSEFSRGEQHTCNEPPVLIAGGGGGTIRTGRQINYNAAGAGTGPMETDASLHNLYTTFLQAFGETDEHFGNDDAWRRGPLDLT
ncbi:MAG: DUF1552 domain-containing protein [Myxococcota bacterium]